VWTLVIVEFDEFPVELEPGMFKVVALEPSFNLTKRCSLADAAEDMFDPLLRQILLKVTAPIVTSFSEIVSTSALESDGICS
jgi:hypothetical protein